MVSQSNTYVAFIEGTSKYVSLDSNGRRAFRPWLKRPIIKFGDQFDNHLIIKFNERTFEPTYFYISIVISQPNMIEVFTEGCVKRVNIHGR